MGMRSVRAVNKPLISRATARKRVEYAKKFRTYNWKRVIFSDEKIFRVRPGGHIRFVPSYKCMDGRLIHASGAGS